MKKGFWFFLVLFILVCLLAVTITKKQITTTGYGTSNGTVSPAFFDNFDSGSRSADQNGYGWGGTMSAVSISNDRAYSGSYSLKFSYGPDSLGEYPNIISGIGGNGVFTRTDGGTWTTNEWTNLSNDSQNLYAYITDSSNKLFTFANGIPPIVTGNDATHVYFSGNVTGGTKISGEAKLGKTVEQYFYLGNYDKELWIEYEIYIPSNYFHRLNNQYFIGGTNNKFLLLWRDTYNWAPNDTGVGFEMYPITTGSYPNLVSTGTTYQRMPYTVNYTELSSPNVYLANSSSTKPFIGSNGYLVPGQWNDVRFHLKTSSANGASDGVVEMWANGQLIFQKLNAPFYGTVNQGFHNGYLMGASNSGYTNETDFYIDDFKIYNQDPQWTNSVTIPIITNLSRDAGTVNGGTSLIITGNNFTSQTTVTFGGTTATNVTLLSSTQLNIVTPSHALGTVDVTVSNSGNSATLSQGFTYLPAPTVIYASSDFENGTLSPFTINGAGVSISNDQAYTGNYSVKASYNGSTYNDGWSGLRWTSSAIKNPAYDDPNGLYTRWYVYIPTNTFGNINVSNIGNGNPGQIKLYLSRTLDGSGQPGWIMSGVGYGFAGNYKLSNFIDDGIVTFPAPSISYSNVTTNNTWTEIEMWDHRVNGTGYSSGWINGKLMWQNVNYSLLGQDGDAHQYFSDVGMAYYQTAGPISLYIDDVAYANGFIDSVGTSTGTSQTNTTTTNNSTNTTTITNTGTQSVSSGGGGGGSATTPIVTNRVTNPITNETTVTSEIGTLNLTPASPGIFSNFAPDTGVQQVELNVNSEVSNVTVTVSQYGTQPSAVPVQKTGNVYEYLHIEPQNTGNSVSSATVTFNVNKTWINENNISIVRVVLFKFYNDSNSWKELQTNYTGSDLNHYSYTAEVPGFSYFAIGEATKSILSENIPFGLVVIILVAVILIILIMILVIRNKRREYY